MSDIVSFVAVLISAISMFIVWRKSPHEIRQLDSNGDSTDADTASKYLLMADRAAERAINLGERVNTMQTRIDVLERRLHGRDRLIIDLLDGIIRLIAQIVAYGESPKWHPGPIADYLDVDDPILGEATGKLNRVKR